ncbi:unnamed protein product [Bursaphelenchus xylophilus]|uniref:(pine wood nematode) hypothetical protein n=1 Tax=Bursaphelenchus xylophilus TaxID=6326 RepID=A0A1I7RRJ8_BURXY|nr:unnamed protein product [Bursaphelenchus xylophilus]CAG9131081.1 unnamed protein product [Bursaphelenchus xylophilus]
MKANRMLVTQETEIEICQRFVKLSCEKMMQSRGTGKLRRNLLILRLLRKARQDMHRVPYECAELIQQTGSGAKSPLASDLLLDDEVDTGSLSPESSLWRWKDRRSLNLDESNMDCSGPEDRYEAPRSREPTMTVVFDADAEEEQKNCAALLNTDLDPDFDDFGNRQELSDQLTGKLLSRIRSRDEEVEEEDDQPPAIFQCDLKAEFYSSSEPSKVEFHGTDEDAVVPKEINDLPYDSEDEGNEEDEFTDSEFDDEGGLLDGRSDEKRRLRKRKPHRSGSGRSEKRAKDADADSGVDVDGVVLNGIIDEQCVPSL